MQRMLILVRDVNVVGITCAHIEMVKYDRVYVLNHLNIIVEYAWKTIAKIATDVIEKMDMLVIILLLNLS